MTYSCVQGGMPGTGNISSNPLFIHDPPQAFFLLSQTAAGQAQNSPCVDASYPSTPMITGTTRTDYVQDAGVVDMGFHWWMPENLSERLWYELKGEFEIGEKTGCIINPECVELCIGNYPNPFNPITTISLTLDQTAPVRLDVMDICGRSVCELFRGNLAAGQHEFSFSGESLPSGVYVYRADVAGQFLTGKALLVK